MVWQALSYLRKGGKQKEQQQLKSRWPDDSGLRVINCDMAETGLMRGESNDLKALRFLEKRLLKIFTG